MALGLRGEGDELLEHHVAGGAGEVVDVGGGQALGGDGVEDWRGGWCQQPFSLSI